MASSSCITLPLIAAENCEFGIGLSVHFIIYNNKRGVRYIIPLSVINQVSLSRGSKSKQSKHSEEKYFQDSKTFPVEKSDFQLD